MLAGSSLGSAITSDIYQELKNFLLSLKDHDKKLIIKNTSTSLIKPDTFINFKLDRISNKAAFYLSSLSKTERSNLIEKERQQSAGNEDQMIIHLVCMIQSKIV